MADPPARPPAPAASAAAAHAAAPRPTARSWRLPLSAAGRRLATRPHSALLSRLSQQAPLAPLRPAVPKVTQLARAKRHAEYSDEASAALAERFAPIVRKYEAEAAERHAKTMNERLKGGVELTSASHHSCFQLRTVVNVDFEASLFRQLGASFAARNTRFVSYFLSSR